MKLRINAGDKNAGNAQDKAIADAYGNKFIIPLDFEMLDRFSTLLPSRTWKQTMLWFNDYNQVISSAVASPDAKYKITDISLEYEIVTQPNLARSITDEYQNMALLYDRILRHRQILVRHLICS